MIVYFSLGSNLGDREQTIEQALSLMEKEIGPLIKRSSFYFSAPWGFESPNTFCNLCACYATDYSPHQVLRITQSIERRLGRVHKSTSSSAQTPHYTDRPIDIDLLLYYTDEETEIRCNTPHLTLPHPLMREREFVMIPLREIWDRGDC